MLTSALSVSYHGGGYYFLHFNQKLLSRGNLFWSTTMKAVSNSGIWQGNFRSPNLVWESHAKWEISNVENVCSSKVSSFFCGLSARGIFRMTTYSTGAHRDIRLPCIEEVAACYLSARLLYCLALLLGTWCEEKRKANRVSIKYGKCRNPWQLYGVSCFSHREETTK